jgi:monooxygenase
MSHEHVDVIVVGAGLSGIDAGYHLGTKCPGKSYVILEASDSIGGTWRLFRYPGVRSDSDMYTLGFPFRPWVGDRALVDGPSILDYVRQTAAEYGIDRHIRFGHKVVRAQWSTRDSRWTVEASTGPDGRTTTFTCGFLLLCSGYYDHGQGYSPQLPGAERFDGRIVHPQQWPEDLDYAGKRVAVIGSGATAVTLVPALAESAARVTMVQRSPSYVLSVPATDALARGLDRFFPARLAFALIRWKNILFFMALFNTSRRAPRLMKKLIRRGVQSRLGNEYAIDIHFAPKYNPWQQRMCFVPDGDLFRAIKRGDAAVATGEIETLTESGLRLTSGETVDADIIVTATGLNLVVLGGIEFVVDGQPVDLPTTLAYRGMMVSGVPNMAFAIGYTNASWTLKCDLTCAFTCRLLNYMDKRGYTHCVPRLSDPAVEAMPIIDFTSGYVQRSIDRFPRQGSKRPWRLYQNYLLDLTVLKLGAVADGSLEFHAAPSARRATAPGQKAG